MSSLVLSPAQSWQSQMENMHRELSKRNHEISDLREELRKERQKSESIQVGVAELRLILRPLHSALGRVFEETESMGVIDQSPNPANPHKAAVWESWKQKLGGQAAKAIDVLALHGEMSAVQLRIHLGCANTHVYNVITQLNKAGIINKNGGKISLKEL